MTRVKQSWGIWCLGLALLLSTVGGAVWVVHTRAGEDQPILPDGTRPPVHSNIIHKDIDGAVCQGSVDVDGKVIDLYPVALGRIDEIPVTEGQLVKEGDILLRVDDRQAKNAVRLADASVLDAKASLDEARQGPDQKKIAEAIQNKVIKGRGDERAVAQSNLEHAQEMRQANAISAKDVDVAQHKLEAAVSAHQVEVERLLQIQLKNPEIDIAKAEANLKAKEVALEQAKVALDQCVLKAPVDGKVLRIFVAKGETLGPQPKAHAIQLCPSTKRIIRVAVEQEYVPRVAVGMKVLIEDDVSSPGTWHGVVRKMDDYFLTKRHPEMLSFNDVRTIEAIVDLDPGQPHLEIGRKVRVKMTPAH